MGHLSARRNLLAGTALHMMLKRKETIELISKDMQFYYCGVSENSECKMRRICASQTYLIFQQLCGIFHRPCKLQLACPESYTAVVLGPDSPAASS